MSIKQTSLEAYEEVLKNLGECQAKVLQAFKELGLATNQECANHLCWGINRVTPRVLELRRMKVLEYVETRKDKVTGRNAMVWRIKSYEAGKGVLDK